MKLLILSICVILITSACDKQGDSNESRNLDKCREMNEKSLNMLYSDNYEKALDYINAAIDCDSTNFIFIYNKAVILGDAELYLEYYNHLKKYKTYFSDLQLLAAEANSLYSKGEYYIYDSLRTKILFEAKKEFENNPNENGLMNYVGLLNEYVTYEEAIKVLEQNKELLKNPDNYEIMLKTLKRIPNHKKRAAGQLYTNNRKRKYNVTTKPNWKIELDTIINGDVIRIYTDTSSIGYQRFGPSVYLYNGSLDGDARIMYIGEHGLFGKLSSFEFFDLNSDISAVSFYDFATGTGSTTGIIESYQVTPKITQIFKSDVVYSTYCTMVGELCEKMEYDVDYISSDHDYKSIRIHIFGDTLRFENDKRSLIPVERTLHYNYDSIRQFYYPSNK